MNPLTKLIELGQSPWFDYIERRLLEDGELAKLIAQGEIRGITSNPSIFHQAIAKSQDYDTALVTLAWAGASAQQIYDSLTIEDVQAADDLFYPLYQESQAGDGYVSLEVSPELAHDTLGTLAEARRLWSLVKRPNLMIKIPATREGLPAVRQAIAEGINVNVTLIFSLKRYAEVMEAYLEGLEQRLEALEGSLPLDHIASVASFFVSRMDTKVDLALSKLTAGPQAASATALMGKAALANARLAYQLFRQVFGSPRFQRLQAQGARLQRPLWASTSTKNPAYPDTLYVDSLIGPDTVNTLPPQTLDAFRQHGRAIPSLEEDLEAARQVFEDIESLGISVDQVTRELEQEGVQAFANAFTALLEAIETRRQAALMDLGPLAEVVAQRVTQLQEQDFPRRLHAGDASLWTADPQGQEEIRKRLGWLELPGSSHALLDTLDKFREEVLGAGFTHALLLGMGGSSLAPEVMRLVFGAPPKVGDSLTGLNLAILDSTDPAQVRTAARRSPIRRTLYIVASKSGGTAEVKAFLDYIWHRARRVLKERAGDCFIAITDPGTSLEKLAQERGFRQVFLADPTVGGRYSVLSAFGLVPAALMGLDIALLLDRASWMAAQCAAQVPANRNPGLVLGAVMAEAARLGRDKLTLTTEPRLVSLGAWLEQLIAESSGKQGVGIVPVDGEPIFSPEVYRREQSEDRLFVYLGEKGAQDSDSRKVSKPQAAISRLRQVGQPALTFRLNSPYDLGAEFYRWEVATAVACAILGVNAFDQPDVQDNKNRTVQKIKEIQQTGGLSEGKPFWTQPQYRLYTPPSNLDLTSPLTLKTILDAFLAQAMPGDYVGLNVYLPRNLRMRAMIQRLRVAILNRTGCATMVGFGPRFLHSSGQLHKGGPDHGLFLLITAEPAIHLPIPGQGLTFGDLEKAQALGDFEALQARGRRVMRLHLNSTSLAGFSDLNELIKALE